MGYKNDAQRKAAHASMAEQSPAKNIGSIISSTAMGNNVDLNNLQPTQPMTNIPPQQANTMGNSQPVFSPRSTQAGTGLFGDMQQRQNSVNAPLMFHKKGHVPKIGMTELGEVNIKGSKRNFGKAAPGKGSGAHGDNKYEKATYQLMDEGAIDETSDANYGRILERMKKNEDAEKYNKIEDGSVGNLTKVAGGSPFNQEIKQESIVDIPSKSFKIKDQAIEIRMKPRVKYFKEAEKAPEVKMAKMAKMAPETIIQKPHKQIIPAKVVRVPANNLNQKRFPVAPKNPGIRIINKPHLENPNKLIIKN
jgi:hypothetical protein